MFLGFFSGFLDSIGINILIPIFSFFTKNQLIENDPISKIVAKVFSYLPFEYNLRSLLILVALIFIFRAVVLVIFSYISNKIRIDYRNDAVGVLLSRIFNAKWPFLLKQKLGYIQTTLIKDLQVNSDVMTFLGHFIVSITGLIIYSFFAMSISMTMTLISLLMGGIFLFLSIPLV
jgi:ABC-type multidrug transport system fused ATPase/permease subunit